MCSPDAKIGPGQVRFGDMIPGAKKPPTKAAPAAAAAPTGAPIDNSPVPGVNAAVQQVSRKRRGGLQISQSNGSGLNVPV